MERIALSPANMIGPKLKQVGGPQGCTSESQNGLRRPLQARSRLCPIEGGSVVSGYGWLGAQLQMVEAARRGVSRSGEGMFRPHLDTLGSDDSSSRGLRSGRGLRKFQDI